MVIGIAEYKMLKKRLIDKKDPCEVSGVKCFSGYQINNEITGILNVVSNGILFEAKPYYIHLTNISDFKLEEKILTIVSNEIEYKFRAEEEIHIVNIYNKMTKKVKSKEMYEYETKEEFIPNSNYNSGSVSCPKCGSIQITAQKKGFGVGKAAIGFLTFGVLGSAAGGIGSNKILITCLNCGHQWKPGKK